MPISMLKTYDTDWKRNGQGIDGTANFAIFRLFKGNKSGLLFGANWKRNT